ncbi:MAG TPA: hypothetical protein EYQ00_02050 [Dehalococcoidia bacterium]|nr:hypothetical protein [Dehalococcoidia bacterium]
MLMPVVSSSTNDLEAIMEFTRTEADSPFFDEDEEIANSYLVWGELATHYATLYGNVGRQKDMSGFLLSIVRSIFMEMVSMDALIIKIMNFAQKLVTADRASLFLVDSKTNQLYARIFDISGGADKDETAAGAGADGSNKDFTKEIRFDSIEIICACENHLVY